MKVTPTITRMICDAYIIVVANADKVKKDDLCLPTGSRKERTLYCIANMQVIE